jgi:gliding motility-associated-like protein
VDTSGYYSVNIKWKGCEVTSGVWIIREYMPYFTLPNDTAICAGDTLILEAPLDIDSATYIWGSGLHFGRKFRMYFEGTISLSITVGNCSWQDEIHVDLIRPFQMSLGDDTTLCLGETYELRAPPNVDYVWSNGQTGRKLTVYNQDQTIWLRAWNSCFEKVDTVSITYEECDCHFFVANTFSPNNDGVNDIFMPVSSCLYEQFQMEIYDRWGTLIYATDKLDQGWDGTFKGKNMPQGVYSYQLRYKKFSWHAAGDYERGTINLIR